MSALVCLLNSVMGASLVAQMVKNLPTNAGNPGSIPGWGRSPGEKNGCSLQYSCLEAWTEEPGSYSPWANKELDTTE